MIKSIITFLTILFFSVPTAEETTYTLDKAHTFIEFRVERFMVGEVSGKFREFDGEIIYEEGDPSSLKMDVIIQAGSLDTDHETRDSHLRGETWLHVEEYPEIRFVSKEVTKEGAGYAVTGDLTIHGTTKEVSFPFTLKGPFKDPTGMVTIGLAGELAINRQDFGINFSKIMDNGEVFIGNEVKIDIHALGVQKSN